MTALRVRSAILDKILQNVPASLFNSQLLLRRVQMWHVESITHHLYLHSSLLTRGTDASPISHIALHAVVGWFSPWWVVHHPMHQAGLVLPLHDARCETTGLGARPLD